jgi:hypothetical protein
MFNNFTLMSETFIRFWGIVAANDYKTEYNPTATAYVAVFDTVQHI